MLHSFCIGPWATSTPHKCPASKCIRKHGRRSFLTIGHYVEESASRAIDERELLGLTSRAALRTVNEPFDGFICVRGASLFFDGLCESRVKRLQIPLLDIEFIFNRSGQPPGIEVFTSAYRGYYFDVRSNLTSLWELLTKTYFHPKEPTKFDFFHSFRTICHSICQTGPNHELLTRTNLTNLWQNWASQLTNIFTSSAF
jgi:hypothetical protein